MAGCSLYILWGVAGEMIAGMYVISLFRLNLSR